MNTFMIFKISFKVSVYLLSSWPIFHRLQFQGYSSGPPKGVCGTLKPGHGVDFQSGSGPFSLILAPKVKDGFIEVVLKSSGVTFKGKRSFI